jgi:hypothetical protein
MVKSKTIVCHVSRLRAGRERHVVEVKRCALIRKWLKLPSSAPLPLLHELGCEPLVHSYLCHAVRYYNALLTLEDCCAYKGALCQNVEDAFAASRPAKNLVYALFQVLRILLPSERGLVARFKNRQCIDECEVKLAIQRWYLEHVKQLSLILEGLGSRLGLYFRVVCTWAQDERQGCGYTMHWVQSQVSIICPYLKGFWCVVYASDY